MKINFSYSAALSLQAAKTLSPPALLLAAQHAAVGFSPDARLWRA
ncbi:hypothetical protein AB0E85_05710 [Streptomyces sp. NPDC029044]